MDAMREPTWIVVLNLAFVGMNTLYDVKSGIVDNLIRDG